MNPDVLESYRKQRHLEAIIAQAKRERQGSWVEHVQEQVRELNELVAEMDDARGR